jgi:hypothetical protein
LKPPEYYHRSTTAHEGALKPPEYYHLSTTAHEGALKPPEYYHLSTTAIPTTNRREMQKRADL